MGPLAWALNPGSLVYLLYILYVTLRAPKQAEGSILGAHNWNLTLLGALRVTYRICSRYIRISG